MEKYYQFAGLEFLLKIPDERIYSSERYLAPFAVDCVSDPHVFNFEFVENLDRPPQKILAEFSGFGAYFDGVKIVNYFGSTQNACADAFARCEQMGKAHRVQVNTSKIPERIGTHTVLTILSAEHLIARNGGFVFHCAYIEHHGKAILFTAPSGTGKSTQADLWNQLRGAEIINGDRAAVRIVDGTAIAEGIPFAGSSRHCKNRSLPLQAIVYLAQAPATSIRCIKGYEAFKRIWEGVSVNTWDAKDMAIVSSAVEKVAKSVPVFYLPCTPDESAVIALERALSENGE